MLRPFDLTEVRAAFLAHGWSWQEGRDEILAQLTAHDWPLEPR